MIFLGTPSSMALTACHMPTKLFQLRTQHWSPRVDTTNHSRDICLKLTPQSIWIHCRAYLNMPKQWFASQSVVTIINAKWILPCLCYVLRTTVQVQNLTLSWQEGQTHRDGLTIYIMSYKWGLPCYKRVSTHALLTILLLFSLTFTAFILIHCPLRKKYSAPCGPVTFFFSFREERGGLHSSLSVCLSNLNNFQYEKLYFKSPTPLTLRLRCHIGTSNENGNYDWPFWCHTISRYWEFPGKGSAA